MQITFFDVLWIALTQAAFIWVARALSASVWVQALIWLLLTAVAAGLFFKYFVEREPREK